MTGAVPDANEAMRHYWNTVAGPRWVASPGFRERRNQESLALLAGSFAACRRRERARNRLRHRRGHAAPRRGGRRAWPRRRGRHLRADARGRPAASRRERHAQCHAAAWGRAGVGVRASRVRYRDLAHGRHVLRRPGGGLPQHRQRAETGRASRLRLLGAACGEPALADLLRHRAPPSGTAGDVARSRARSTRLREPRLHPPGSRRGRLRRRSRSSGRTRRSSAAAPRKRRGRR